MTTGDVQIAKEKDPQDPQEKSESRGISTALTTGRSLILLQLVSRLITFTLNQSLVRLASPEIFGTAAIQFDLIYASLLFLSREGVRNALLRRGPSSPSSPSASTAENSGPGVRQADRGLAIVPLYLGTGIATVLSSIYLYTTPVSTTSQRDFHLSLGLYVLAALLELAIEPHYIACLTSIPPKLYVRVQAEGGQAIVKAIVTFTSLYWFTDRPLFGFALGMVSGVGFLMIRYILEYGVDGFFSFKSSDG